MVRTSRRSGTLRRWLRPLAKRVAHISGKVAFLEPLTWMVPLSLAPPLIMSLSMIRPCVFLAASRGRKKYLGICP